MSAPIKVSALEKKHFSERAVMHWCRLPREVLMNYGDVALRTWLVGTVGVAVGPGDCGGLFQPH